MKYHLSDDGPAVCRASVRSCPYGVAGGDHFESLPEAEKAFAESLGGDLSEPLKKPKTYAPVRPEIPTLTLSSVQDILSNLKKIPKHLTTVEGFGYLGSSLYGLHHEDSDQDVFVLVDGKGIGFHQVGEEMDVRVDTVDAFYVRLWESAPEDIDILRSPRLNISGSKYAPLLENFRFDTLHYSKESRQHALGDFKLIVKNLRTPERREKSIKVAVRSIMLARKVDVQGLDYTPEFNDSEREHYYRIVEEVREKVAEGADAWALMRFAEKSANAVY
jgi:hypothetical protein